MDQMKFNDALRGQLTEAGFSEDEIVIGALVSEAKAGLACMRTFGPRGALLGAALSQTFGMLVGKMASVAGLSGERIVAVAETVATKCHALADAEFERQGKNMSDAEQSAEILKGLAEAVRARDAALRVKHRAAGMDPSGPTDPSQIN